MLLILGLGYAGSVLAARARTAGLAVTAVRRSAGPGWLGLDDPALAGLVARADHLLSSVPPDPATGADPVLDRFGRELARRRGWTGYWSSTGVYGDSGGAVVDESAPTGSGRRTARSAADARWLALGAAVVRLPGIYGPGRSALDQLRAGTARRIDRPGHRFNRIHVDDIAGATLALLRAGLCGPFNCADDRPAEPRHVTEWAAALLGMEPPPLEAYCPDRLSPMARGFWAERRIVASGRLWRATGYRLAHPDYKSGLTAIRRGELP